MGNKKKLVFIVEDNLLQQKMLQVHLEEILGNYEVRTFNDPQDLIKRLNEKPHAVVLDHFYENSQKTGLDYLAELRKTHKKVPVIYHTTLDDDDVRKQVMELHAEQYIIKDSASLVRLRTTLDLLQKKKKTLSIWDSLMRHLGA